MCKKRKPFDPGKPSEFKNKHHLFPTSRYLELKNKPDNIVMVPYNEHALYHALFTNRNPYECLDYLVSTFWGGRIGYLKDFLRVYEERKKNGKET